MTEYTYAEAKKQIKFYVRTRGPTWNFIVSRILRQVAAESGDKMAKRLIRECHLADYGWKEEETK